MGYYIQNTGMSMKYFLIIWVCAFINPGDIRCLDPITYPTAYDSWYECSRAAHTESVKVTQRKRSGRHAKKYGKRVPRRKKTRGQG